MKKNKCNVVIVMLEGTGADQQQNETDDKMNIKINNMKTQMQHKQFTLLKPTKSLRSNLTQLKLTVVLFLGLGLTSLQAQESLNATGGDASGSGGSVSYSVGQVAYQTHTGTGGSVSEGVQQAYEISVVTGIEKAKGINLSVTAYPNPTTENLTLSIYEFDISDLSYQLYDMNGKLLQDEKITGTETQIVMSNLFPATYFVKVLQGNNEVKTFKIIKQ